MPLFGYKLKWISVKYVRAAQSWEQVNLSLEVHLQNKRQVVLKTTSYTHSTKVLSHFQAKREFDEGTQHAVEKQMQHTLTRTSINWFPSEQNGYLVWLPVWQQNSKDRWHGRNDKMNSRRADTQMGEDRRRRRRSGARGCVHFGDDGRKQYRISHFCTASSLQWSI